MLGTGIFAVFPKLAAQHNPSVLFILIVWILGTFVAWFGAMCFAELSCIFTSNAGEYLFLKEAYAPNHRQNPISFLFAWAQIFVIRPAALVTLSIVLALHCNVLANEGYQIFLNRPMPDSMKSVLLYLFTFGALIKFTVVSVLGIKTSKWMQNFLTFIKVFSLVMLIIVGLYLGINLKHNLTPLWPVSFKGFFSFELIKQIGMAMVPVMWVFGGWNEAAYISGEVKNPTRNIPFSLTTGLFGLGLLYTIINFIYMLHLTPQGLADSWTFSSDLMNQWFGAKGEITMATIIIFSSAGAINGLTFTGGRMTQAFSEDTHLFRGLAKEHRTFKTPYIALCFNLLLSILIAIFVQCEKDSIDQLLNFTAGVFWYFFAIIVLSLFIFRKRLPHDRIPFKTPLYPLTPIIFLIMCAFMFWGAFEYKPIETLSGLSILLLGLPFYCLSQYSTKRSTDR